MQAHVEVFQDGWWSAWVKRVLVLRAGALLIYDETMANCLTTIKLALVAKTAIAKDEFQLLANDPSASASASASAATLWRVRCASEEELARVYGALRAHLEQLSTRKATKLSKRAERDSPAPAPAPAAVAANDDNDEAVSPRAVAASPDSSAAASRRRRTLSRRLSLTDLGQTFVPSQGALVPAAPSSPAKVADDAAAHGVTVASIAAGTASVEPQLAEELERRLNARMSVAAQQRIAALEELNARLSSDNGALLKQLADDGERESELRRQLAAAVGEREACEERVRALEAAVDVYRFRAVAGGAPPADATSASLQSEVRSLQAEVDALRATRDIALENAQLSEASMRAATEQIVVLNREIGALQGVIAKGTQASSSDIVTPADDMVSLANKLAAKAEACLALKSHVSFLGAQLSRSTDEQRRRTTLRQETIRRLRMQLAHANGRAATLQVQCESLRAQLPLEQRQSAQQLAAQVSAMSPPLAAAERVLDDLDDLRSELTNLRREHFHALVLSIKLSMSREGMPINIDPSVLYDKMLRDKPEGLPIAQWPLYIHTLMQKIVTVVQRGAPARSAKP